MNVFEIYFSPTGGTKKVTDLIAWDLSDNVTDIDITVRDDVSCAEMKSEDICVIGVPSFGGRVPAVAAERILKIRGNGAKAILIAVYGNRAYEDTLAELEDTARSAGFAIVGAIAAIAEHSIVRKYAAGRPDDADKNVLQMYAQKIKEKLQKGDGSVPEIPGSHLYKERSAGGLVPGTDKNCVRCGICVVNCPVGAIDKADPTKTDKKKCISCMRCVAVCPHTARKINSVMLFAAGMMLKKSCEVRKECELYL